MPAIRWTELPEHLKGRVAKDRIAPQKPRTPPAPPPQVAAEPAPVTKNKRNRNEESEMSCAVAKWRDDCLELKLHPELRWFHAVPNGGRRGKRSAGLAKGEGQLPGVLDWDLPVVRGAIDASWPKWPFWAGLKVELKLPKYRKRPSGGLKPLQSEFADFVTAQGYMVVTCYTAAEAIDAVEAYLALPKVNARSSCPTAS